MEKFVLKDSERRDMYKVLGVGMKMLLKAVFEKSAHNSTIPNVRGPC